MTIITAAQKGDQIAIACDSQTTGGDTKYTADYSINRSKLLHYGDSIWGLSGSMSVHQAFEDLLAEVEPVPLTSRRDLFRWLLDQQKRLKEDYYIKTDVASDRTQAVDSSRSNALVATPHGIFSINQYRSVHEYGRFWAIGSGSSLAIGAMDILYDQDLSASEIAEAGALTATKFNIYCSAPIRVETIQKATEPQPKTTTKRRASTRKTTTKKEASPKKTASRKKKA